MKFAGDALLVLFAKANPSTIQILSDLMNRQTNSDVYLYLLRARITLLFGQDISSALR